MSQKPRLAVLKFASCDGCQLAILDLQERLLELGTAVEVAYFLEATSRITPGPYDIALVEGSVSTPHDLERIQQVRQAARYLVTIGACATAGGIQALRNWADHEEFLRAVYARPEYIATLAHSKPVAECVKVDFELRGCPINTEQLYEVLRSFLYGRRPRTPVHSVCMECKRRGTVCIVVTQQVLCLGPVTQAGCGAICPAYNRGCYGCYGPAREPNLVSLSDRLIAQGTDRSDVARTLRGFNGYAPEFRQESQRLAPSRI